MKLKSELLKENLDLNSKLEKQAEQIKKLNKKNRELKKSRDELTLQEIQTCSGFLSVKLSGTVLRWSEGLNKILEIENPPLNFSLENYFNYILPADKEIVRAEFNRAITKKSPIFFKHKIKTNKKKTKHIQVKGEIVKKGKTSSDFLHCVITELPKPKKSKTIKKVNESKLTKLVETIPHGIQENDLQGRITYVNKAHAKIHGLKQSEIIGKYIWDLQKHPSEKKQLKSYLQYLIKEQPAPTPYFSTDVAKNGKTVNVKVDWDYNRDADGNLIGFISVLTDVTKTVQTEEALKSSEERLRLVLKSAKQGMYDFDIKSGSVTINEEYAKMLGYNPQRFKESKEKWVKRIHPGDRKQVLEVLDSYQKNKTEEYSSIFRLKAKSGKWIWILSVGEIVEWDLKGKPVRMLGTHTDITKQKETEENLRESEETFRTLSKLAPVGIYRNLPDGNCTYINDRCSEIIGLSFDEAMGFGWTKNIHPDDKDRVEKAWRDTVKAEQPYFEEHRFLRPDGTSAWVISEAFAVKSDEGKVLSYVGSVMDISAHVDAVEKLSENERRNATLLKNLPGMAYICRNDKDWTMLFVSEGCNKLIGYNPKDIINNSLISYNTIIHKEDRELVWQEISKSLKSKNHFEIEYRIVHNSGNIKWVWERGVGIYGVNDSIETIEGFITDITDRKNAERILQENEIRFRALFEQAGIGVAQIITKTGQFIRINKKYCEIIGFTEKEALSNTFQQITHKDDLAEELKNMNKLIKGDITEFTMEKRYYHKNGSIVWVNLTVSPMWRPGGDPNYHIAVVEDITEKKETQLALKESEEQYKLLFESNPHPMFVWDVETYKFVNANASAVRQYGYTKDEFLSMTIKDIRPKEDVPPLMKLVKDIDDSLQTRGWRHIKKNGEIIFVDITANQILYNNRESVVVIAYDITEKFKAEQALIESEQKFHAVYAHSHDCIYISSADHKIVEMNEAGLNLLGYRSNEMKNIKINDLFSDTVQKKTYNKEISKYGFVKDFYAQLKKKNGELFDGIITSAIRKDEQGNVVNYQGMIIDITNQKNVERALIKAKEEAERADRLKTEFLAQMSHEIRTPINTLLSFSSLIKEEFSGKADEQTLQYFSYQSSAGNRIIRTIDLVLNMSEIQTGAFATNIKRLSLNSLLDEIFVEYKGIAKEKDLYLISEIGDVEYFIDGDEYSLHQVFRNLIDNAIKYTPEGGIMIRMNRVNSYIKVEVADTGIGIAQKYLSKIFEPFTQEEQGYTRRFEGSGLGLSLVKKYCDLNNVGIEVESQKGIGTKFIVSFNFVK